MGTCYWNHSVLLCSLPILLILLCTPTIKREDTYDIWSSTAAKTKTKSAHKRRKASINFRSPKPRKKKAVACSRDSDNHTDLIDFNVKDKTTRNEENEESSELSEEDKERRKTNKTIQIARTKKSQDSHRKTPATTQSNTLSTLSSTGSRVSSTSKQLNIMSPDLLVGLREGNCMENEIVQTDKNFLQQQIQFFATGFTLQDCPSLAG